MSAPTKALSVTAGDIERARDALRALVGETMGVSIPDRGRIELFCDGGVIAKIEITDDGVWREFAHDLGFRP